MRIRNATFYLIWTFRTNRRLNSLYSSLALRRRIPNKFCIIIITSRLHACICLVNYTENLIYSVRHFEMKAHKYTYVYTCINGMCARAQICCHCHISFMHACIRIWGDTQKHTKNLFIWWIKKWTETAYPATRALCVVFSAATAAVAHMKANISGAFLERNIYTYYEYCEGMICTQKDQERVMINNGRTLFCWENVCWESCAALWSTCVCIVAGINGYGFFCVV